MKLKPSYTWTESTSSGVRSVRSHIIVEASRSAIVVRSSNWSHDGRPCRAEPMASIRIGGRRRSGAESARETMTAVEPSAGTSQS